MQKITLWPTQEFYERGLTAHHYYVDGPPLLSKKLPYFDLTLSSEYPILMLDYNVVPSIVSMKVKVNAGLTIPVNNNRLDDVRFDFAVKDLTTMGTLISSNIHDG